MVSSVRPSVSTSTPMRGGLVAVDGDVELRLVELEVGVEIDEPGIGRATFVEQRVDQLVCSSA